jgi:hypothetical protein
MKPAATSSSNPFCALALGRLSTIANRNRDILSMGMYMNHAAATALASTDSSFGLVAFRRGVMGERLGRNLGDRLGKIGKADFVYQPTH